MSAPGKQRGVLYVVWNRGKSGKHDAALERSIRSLHALHPELGIHIHDLPATATLLDKAGMYQWSPFEETLYLDIDTVVMDRLDYGFERAAKHHVALAIAPAPYARRYFRMISGDVIEYNTGVIFWKKSPESGRLFGEWERLARTEDSAHQVWVDAFQVATLPSNDQASFAKAVDSLNFVPFVLPPNWNFRPAFARMFCGPIKVWHDYADIPAGVKAASDQMRSTHIMQFVGA